MARVGLRRASVRRPVAAAGATPKTLHMDTDTITHSLADRLTHTHTQALCYLCSAMPGGLLPILANPQTLPVTSHVGER